MENSEILQNDYADALRLYSNQPSRIVGRLVMGRNDVTFAPISIDKIYQDAYETLSNEPERAMQWAQTFGEVSVSVALDSSNTRFSLDQRQSYPPARTAEIRTACQVAPRDFFVTDQADGPLAFVLVNTPQRPELNLIKALHMLDYGVVTGQLDPKNLTTMRRPLVLFAEEEELLRLRRDNPDIRLRMYGNVRQAVDASMLLGTVVSTSLVEHGGMKYQSTSTLPIKEKERTTVSLTKPKAVAIGITTAKRPHIGHAFLLAKAQSIAGTDSEVVIEMNDYGPRVAQAVQKYAVTQNISFDEAATAITSGDVEMAAIEEAYKTRSTVENTAVLPDYFALTAGNNFMTEIFSKISGDDRIVPIANSSLKDTLTPLLMDNPGAGSLFVNLEVSSGMSLLSDEVTGQSVVIETAGRPTMVGIIGALSARYELTFVDSIRTLDQRSEAIFTAAGLKTEQVEGMGIALDFQVASGTNGNSVPLDELVSIAETEGYDSTSVLLACRLMLESCYYVKGDGNSIIPNFASKSAILEAFNVALKKTDTASKLQLYEPIKLQRVDRALAIQAFQQIMGDVVVASKPTVAAILRLNELFPTLNIDDTALAFAAEHQSQSDLAIPRNLRRMCDEYWNKLYAGNTAMIYDLIGDFACTAADKAADILKDTELAQAMAAMGYSNGELEKFLSKMKGVSYVARFNK